MIESKFQRSLPKVYIIKGGLFWLVFNALSVAVSCHGVEARSEVPHPAVEASVQNTPKYYIREYRVLGAHQLKREDVERAVYPFLGPGRTEMDVEGARAALENAYHNHGFQTVRVEIPPQNANSGVIFVQVDEMKVGRLRVKGARYYLLSTIKERAMSMAEGKVVNFDDVRREIVALNCQADLRVNPSLKPGVAPDTVDIDLDVKDTPPLHGSVELNNRYSSDTSPLRVNAAVSYNNLWQLGHSIGFSTQVAPEDLGEVKVFSGYYVARFESMPCVGWMLQGTKQESNVSTLGGAAVAGRGEYYGPHVLIELPSGKDFFHSLNFGIDYKHFDQNIVAVGEETLTPISYYPFSALYSATWAKEGVLTELNGGVNWHLRGMGSGGEQFDSSRYGADGEYIYLKADLAQIRDLPWGMQAYGKVQGQLSDKPLINSEQFSAGGLSTVRGYIESAVVGDNALCGTLELRSPSLGNWFGKRVDEWRLYLFVDAATLAVKQVLSGQDSNYQLASYGVGSRVRFREHLNGTVDLGVPLMGAGPVHAGDLLLTFRLWADF